MRRSLLAYLEDINLALSDLEAFMYNKSLAEYKADRLLQAAVERKFTIIGEAFARIEQHFPGDRERIADVRAIVAFRNLLIHQYETVDLEEVFNIVRGPMPQLKTQINAWILELDPSAAS